ncbi:response regulator transcription factor [Corynebacterium sp. HMSC074E01]|uniref:response regulator transcription factor n=1 Tax=Corynebacterium sp. HMSC074E01 TaxID=1715017 RepID=UPI0008A17CB6|nr:response regulator transcription factor [Corynebacterium sp. HMSC074E01]OFN77216.1 DNA-binding response regulator [Corynebacterium sp. HMSC074E01]
MTTPIRVLIAENQSLVRGALTALLNAEPDIDVVADCSSGNEVAGLVAQHSVDVALLDIEMPGMNGIDAAHTIADTGCRSLIVTTFGRSGYVKRALQAGVDGFLVKDTPPDELADAIRRVHSGLRVIDPQLAQDILFAPDNPLSEREIEVCRLLVRGLGSADIASQLHLSGGTVRNHVSAIMAKTRAGNRFEAARRAEANGWI